MKGRNHARFVGIGRETPAFVDKPAVTGRVFTKREIIDLQLQGVPIQDGELYGANLSPDRTGRAHPERDR